MIRPAYPDELSRARALGQGAAMPGSAQFLVALVEHPVERIIAAFPYWPLPVCDDSDTEQATHEFAVYFGTSSADQEQLLDDALAALETAARDAGASHLRCQSSFPENHSLYQKLTGLGYEIAQTDRQFTVPGDIVKQRSIRIYNRLKSSLPENWRVESIRGHNPKAIYKLVAQHQLMAPQQFQHYWNSSNSEHFEENYSCILLDGEEIIGTFLITRRGDHELHVHVEAADLRHMSQLRLISSTLRNHSFSQCPDGFPENLTFRADSKLHRQTKNNALRLGGEELPHQYVLCKSLSRSN